MMNPYGPDAQRRAASIYTAAVRDLRVTNQLSTPRFELELEAALANAMRLPAPGDAETDR
jgi:hypothetical protein